MKRIKNIIGLFSEITLFKEISEYLKISRFILYKMTREVKLLHVSIGQVRVVKF